MRPGARFSQSNWFRMGIIQKSVDWMCLRWRSRMVMIWYFDIKSPVVINIPYIPNGQLFESGWFVLVFMINDQKFLVYKISFSCNFCRVFSKTHRVCIQFFCFFENFCNVCLVFIKTICRYTIGVVKVGRKII